MNMIPFSPLNYRPATDTTWWQGVGTWVFHDISDATFRQLKHVAHVPHGR